MNLKRPSPREKFLFVIPVVILCVPLLLRVKDSKAGLHKIMLQLSGPDAIDCDAKGSSAVIPTIKTGKPFISSDLQYEPTDSTYYLFGKVRTPQGEMFDLCWQCSPWYSLSPGKLNWIARVKHLKFLPNNGFGFSQDGDGGNILTEGEQRQLLQSPSLHK